MTSTLETVGRIQRPCSQDIRFKCATSTSSSTISSSKRTEALKVPQLLWNTQDRAIRSYYADSTLFGSFIKRKDWAAPHFIAKLIAEGPLKNQELKILDAGCHHGNLLHAMNNLSRNGAQLNIKTYTGLDFSESAIDHAREAFPEHNYTTGDALDPTSYREIPNKSMNLITCCGVIDYLTPSKIKLLLNNFNSKLSDEDDTRIYLTYRTTRPQYGLEKPIERRLPPHITKTLQEEGIVFYGFPDPDVENLLLLNYSPDDIRKLVESTGFEIDTENSISRRSVTNIIGSEYDYIALKRKKTPVVGYPSNWLIVKKLNLVPNI